MKELAADIAYTFHFPPSELDRMNVDDLLDWAKQSDRIAKEIKRASKTK